MFILFVNKPWILLARLSFSEDEGLLMVQIVLPLKIAERMATIRSLKLILKVMQITRF